MAAKPQCRGSFLATVFTLAAAAITIFAAPTLRGASSDSPAKARQPKHLLISFAMHCYPFNRGYDDTVNYSDRPMLYDPTMSARQSSALKVKQMMDGGVDVFVQTSFYALGRPPVGQDTTKGLEVVQRTMNAAQGKPIKVSIEVCAAQRAEQYGLKDLAGYLKEAVDRFYDNPNTFKHDGRMVFFFWNPFNDNKGPRKKGFTPERMTRLWELMPGYRDKMYVILEDYYLVSVYPLERVKKQWDENYLKALMQAGDDMFWWHNSADPRDQAVRNDMLATWLRANTNAPIIASARPGYFRKNTGGLIPFHATLEARGLWHAARSVDPDWIYLYSWDDYSENGMWEPTRNNRGMYSALIRTLSRDWKGLPIDRPPSLWIGTPQCMYRGKELYIEVIQLNDPGATHDVELTLKDAKGKAVYRARLGTPSPDPSRREGGKAKVTSQAHGAVKIYAFSIDTTDTNLLHTRQLVPVVKITTSTKPDLSESASKGPDQPPSAIQSEPSSSRTPPQDRLARSRTITGLAPIRLSSFHWRSPLYRFTRLDEVHAPQKLTFTETVTDENQTGEALPRGYGQRRVTGRFKVIGDGTQGGIRRAELRAFDDQVMPYQGPRAPRLDSHPDMQEWRDAKSNRTPEAAPDPFYLPLKKARGDAANTASGTFDFTTRKMNDASGALYLFIEYADGSTYAALPDHVDRQLSPGRRQPVKTTEFDLYQAPASTDLTRKKPAPIDANSQPTIWRPVRSYEISQAQALIGDWDLSVGALSPSPAGGGRVGESTNADSAQLKVDPRKSNQPSPDPSQGEGGSQPSDDKRDRIPNQGGFGFPLYLGYGPNTRTFRGSDANFPMLKDVDGDGKPERVFDGKDDVLRLPDAMLPPGAVTLAMRLRVNKLTGHPQWLVFHKHRDIMFSLQLTQTGQVRFARGGGYVAQSDQPVPVGQWVEVRASDDGKRLTLSINGSQVAQRDHPPLPINVYSAFWTDLILIGGAPANRFPDNEHFNGAIQHVRIWGGAPDE